MSLFITFEGIDGCGKSTQMRFLSEYLDEKKIQYIVTREPGGCPIAEKIRELLLDVENAEMSIYTELFLYSAARVQHVDEVILPALRAGKVVLCDRYVDSNVAYQGYGRGIGSDKVLEANRYAMRKCPPDITFLFDFGYEDAQYRKRKRTEQDRLEQEDSAFFHRVYDGYMEQARRNSSRIRLIDVSGTKWETRDKIRAIFDAIWEKQG